jgi:hypothetical protein
VVGWNNKVSVNEAHCDNGLDSNGSGRQFCFGCCESDNEASNSTKEGNFD